MELNVCRSSFICSKRTSGLTFHPKENHLGRLLEKRVLSKAFGLKKEKSATAEEKVESNFVTLSKDLLSPELRMRLLWRNVYICLKPNNLHNYSYSVEKPKGSFWRG